MPSKVLTGGVHTSAAPDVIAAAVRNGVHKPTSITIDNDLGGADRIITIQDRFTPDQSAGHPAAWTAQTAPRHQITALLGDVVTLGEEDLKGVKCLGNLEIIANVADTGCIVSVGYETE